MTWCVCVCEGGGCHLAKAAQQTGLYRHYVREALDILTAPQLIWEHASHAVILSKWAFVGKSKVNCMKLQIGYCIPKASYFLCWYRPPVPIETFARWPPWSVIENSLCKKSFNFSIWVAGVCRKESFRVVYFIDTLLT